MDLESLYERYYKKMFGIAYRMLGTVTDAEDLVQDLFVALKKIDFGPIDNVEAYLTKMMTNRCLNFLGSAARRRELYTGPWLPEPLFGQAESPAETVERTETVSYAFMVMLERLTPVERAVFVLREAFGYDYADIAAILEKSEANCRKIMSRAKSKLPSGVMPSISERDTVTSQMSDMVSAFMVAATTGSFTNLLGLLTDDAQLISDGGGKARAALRPIYGKGRVQAFLEGISAKGSLGSLLRISMNGQEAVAIVQDGRPTKVIGFGYDVQARAFSRVFLISNPDKLHHLPFFIT